MLPDFLLLDEKLCLRVVEEPMERVSAFARAHEWMPVTHSRPHLCGNGQQQTEIIPLSISIIFPPTDEALYSKIRILITLLNKGRQTLSERRANMKVRSPPSSETTAAVTN